MSMIKSLESAIAEYERRIGEMVERVTDEVWGDHNPGAIAGLYADLSAMTTDLYSRRQAAENLRRFEEEESTLPDKDIADER